VRYLWGDRFQLEKTALIFSDFQGRNSKKISGIAIGDAIFMNYHSQSRRLAIASGNHLILSTLENFKSAVEAAGVRIVPISDLKSPKNLPLVKFSAQPRPDTPVANGFNAPYFHQVYDVPNWFNGHWACGATTALMGLQYYKILPAWPVNCSYPYAHESSHGRYICEIYSFNGYTYNVGGYDPDGNVGYGGYGFIIQNNWADTKGNMAKYARQHGVGSDVDWSPNFSKFSQNITAAFPVVILNSLTTAGHYILGVGEIAAQHAVKVNDPYGNKNQGYMNYNGKNVTYDWPGYSNGHANLNIVHCFIYMRQGADLTITVPEIPDTLGLSQILESDFIVRNVGTKRADTSQVGIYLSLDKVLNTNDRLLTTVAVPKIDADDSVRLSWQIQLPDSLPSYRWSLIAIADDENLLLETDENNNVAYSQFILKGYPRIFRMRPIANSTVDTDQPEISAYFSDPYFPVISDSIKLLLDGVDYSDSLSVAGNKVIFQPGTLLSHTEHRVRLEAPNSAGNCAVAVWNFFILSTDVAKQNQTKIDNFRLFQNYPNPFNSETNIRFEAPVAGTVQLEIFSPDGSLIRQYEFSPSAPGKFSLSWDGRDAHNRIVGSGIYFYRIRSGAFSATKRMIFLK
ncbi:MAG: T9SS type A sorting domain-containing protein, partial [Calditrichaeota bacterium]|nr:T9SS type A sorting domain-containing protein [Calditrichota bacterium]